MYIKQEGMMQMTFTKLPKSITAEELLSTPLPPVKWIVPGLLPAGLALFAGPSKAGKSWLTLWLCLQIAQGNPVWNREIEPRTVIYFSLEDTFNRLQNRIFQLIDGGDAPERLILQTECPRFFIVVCIHPAVSIAHTHFLKCIDDNQANIAVCMNQRFYLFL